MRIFARLGAHRRYAMHARQPEGIPAGPIRRMRYDFAIMALWFLANRRLGPEALSGRWRCVP